MDFDALFNERTFQFSDFQEFTVSFHLGECLDRLKLSQQTPEAKAKRVFASKVSWRWAQNRLFGAKLAR